MVKKKSNEALLRKMSELEKNGEKESGVKDISKDISYYTDFFKKQLLKDPIEFLPKIFKYLFKDD